MYQVLADKDPQGKPCAQVWDRASKKLAETKVKELKAEGYLGVEIWDTQNNSLSRLFKF
jgi:hypothetical protein